MAITDDPAVPDDLRRSSRAIGTLSTAVDGGVRSLQIARTGLSTGSTLVGPCGVRFQASLAALHEGFRAARTAHEEVAEALSRVAGPIEAEQQARQVLKKARGELDDARQRLATEEHRIAALERTTTLRAMSGDHTPIDRSALVSARHEVEEAERAFRRAEHRHEEADADRRRAVERFSAVCRSATALTPAPAAPGAPPWTLLFGPRVQDIWHQKDLTPVGRRRSASTGLTPRERRRLERNGLSPRTPMFSLLHAMTSGEGVLSKRRLFDVRGKRGDASGEVRLGHGEYKASAGLGRIGRDYGVKADAGAEAYALRANAQGKIRLGPVGGKAGADAKIGGAEASAGADLYAGPGGARLRAGGELFAGAKMGANAEVDVAGIKPSAGVEGQAGIGGSTNADFGYADGKVKARASVGLALGIGGKVSMGVEVDVPKVANHVEDAAGAVAKGVKGIFD
ncbi:hypothetical protein ACLQ2R_04945 [Streptosporangium sp. DT93]|uniref:hypothetical protein n=1 Tax=Streptosporangium sp. DT93 TaxID=3393428 RepID=UPI003CF45C6A